MDRIRALCWLLLLLLVIIGGCSGTKRKPNAPENTTNAVETDEDTGKRTWQPFAAPVAPVAEAAREPRMVVVEHRLLMPPACSSVNHNPVLIQPRAHRSSSQSMDLAWRKQKWRKVREGRASWRDQQGGQHEPYMYVQQTYNDAKKWWISGRQIW